RIEPRVKPLPLQRGKILDDLLNAYTRGEPWEPVLEQYERTYGRLFREERELYGDIIGDCRRIMEGYVRRWANDPLTYVGSQVELGPIEIEDGIFLTGVADALGEDDRGIWLVERKSHRNLPDENARMWHMQILIYVWLLLKQGYDNIRGIVWDYLRTKAPSKPEVLRDGSLSRRKKIDTTWEVYKQAVIEAGQDPEDYKDMQKALQGRENRFYRRVYMPVTKSMLNPVIKDARITALQIQALQHHPTRRLSRDCARCSYFPLCYAELNRLDTSELLRLEYKPREEVKDDGQEEAEDDEE